jgi:hypothetical protein
VIVDSKSIKKGLAVGVGIIGIIGLLYYLKKKNVFRGSYTRYPREYPIHNEDQTWKYFTTLNKYGTENFKRDLNSDYLVKI